MTKKEMFAKIAVMCAQDEEVVNFCNHEIELLGKKRGSSKPTKLQLANEGIKEAVLEVLGNIGEPMTVTEIVKEMGGVYTPQKISALLRQLIEAEKVVKTVEKKVSRFALA